MRKPLGTLLLSASLVVAGCGGDDGGATNQSDASAPRQRDAATADATLPSTRDASVDSTVADSNVVDGSPNDGAVSASDAAGGPALPDVVDCTAAGQSNCISAAVVRGDQQLTCSAGPEGSSLGEVGTPTWAIYCEDRANELSVQVSFPVQDAGPVHLTTTPTMMSALAFSVSWVDAAAARTVGDMNERSKNLISGTLDGTVGSDKNLEGTLTAAWATPSADCNMYNLGAYPCRPGQLKITFNVPGL